MSTPRDPLALRRAAAAACLIAAPLLVLAGGLVVPWEAENTTAAYLAALAEHPGRGQVSAILLGFGYALFLPGALAMLHRLGGRSVKLGHAGGALAIVGGTLLPGLVASDFYDLALAQAPDRAAAIAIADQTGSYPGAAAFFVPALLGTVGGQILLTVALARARLAPAWVPAVILLAWAVLVLGSTGGLLFGVASLLLLLGLGRVGILALRQGGAGEPDAARAPAPGVGAPRPA